VTKAYNSYEMRLPS